MASKNRISVQLEGTQLAAMQQYLHTKQKTGKRLIKSDHIDDETYEKINQLTKDNSCSITAVIRDSVTFQLNAMHLSSKNMDRKIFPKCSASSFLGQSAALYCSFETEEQREAWLRRL